MTTKLVFLAAFASLAAAATVRSIPNLDYGGKSHTEFLKQAIERSSPGNARLLAELFGGLDIGLELGTGAQAVISVGGAATRCQHQSPCFDPRCSLCYDPLLRIHGECGGASYFTCEGTLPAACLPYTCTAEGGRPSRPARTVMVKKFPRFEDPFCLGHDSKGRANKTSKKGGRSGGGAPAVPTPDWVLTVPEPVTQCQGYDICLDLRCGSCYDPYLGAHTTCGKLTHYDCNSHLPDECKPMRCTVTDINQLFSSGNPESTPRRLRRQALEGETSPLLVRNFPPLTGDRHNCFKRGGQ